MLEILTEGIEKQIFEISPNVYGVESQEQLEIRQAKTAHHAITGQ